MAYSWACTFGLYHPCILIPGLTHAWSIWTFAVFIFDYIIDFGHNRVICLILPCCEVIFMGQFSKHIQPQVQQSLCQGRAWSRVPP